jgi:hypothetical protein
MAAKENAAYVFVVECTLSVESDVNDDIRAFREFGRSERIETYRPARNDVCMANG